MTKQNMNQCSQVIRLNANEKVQIITVTNNNLWKINSNLMNINYENMHYQ